MSFSGVIQCPEWQVKSILTVTRKAKILRHQKEKQIFTLLCDIHHSFGVLVRGTISMNISFKTQCMHLYKYLRLAHWSVQEIASATLGHLH